MRIQKENLWYWAADHKWVELIISNSDDAPAIKSKVVALDIQHFLCLSVSLHINKSVTHRKFWLIETSFEIFLHGRQSHRCEISINKKNCCLGVGSTGKRFFACPSTYKSARQTSDWRQNDSPRFIWGLTGSARFIQLDSARLYFWGLISIHAALALSRTFKQNDSAIRFIGWAGRFNSIHLRSDRCCLCNGLRWAGHSRSSAQYFYIVFMMFLWKHSATMICCYSSVDINDTTITMQGCHSSLEGVYTYFTHHPER
jgi:hypothetical protein